MRKFALLALLAAALAVPSIAAAATPQGKLTGSATVFGGTTFTVSATHPVIDGGTSYVGLEDDKSGNCNGDSGARALPSGLLNPIVCAHYVASSGCCSIGSPKMRFATQAFVGYAVYRITDNGASPDTFAFMNVSTFAQARGVVNKGRLGGDGGAWAFASSVTGDFTITATQ